MEILQKLHGVMFVTKYAAVNFQREISATLVQPQEKLLKLVLLLTPIEKQLRDQSRTRWHGYISELA